MRSQTEALKTKHRTLYRRFSPLLQTSIDMSLLDFIVDSAPLLPPTLVRSHRIDKLLNGIEILEDMNAVTGQRIVISRRFPWPASFPTEETYIRKIGQFYMEEHGIAEQTETAVLKPLSKLVRKE